MTRPSIAEMRLDLSGRRALITGAGRGLGFEIARALAEAGAEVWLNGRRAEGLERPVADLRAEGLTAHAAPFDVTDDQARGRWFAEAPAPDLLINNATLRDRRATPDLPVEAVARLVEVNALAAYALTQLALPSMLAAGRGAVVNMCSIAGPRAGPADPGYTLAKGGLDALTRAQAVELGGQGIRVNGIAPGFFATEANQAMVGNPETEAYLAARVPMARWAEPREIAGAAVFLCSDAASYVNGHILTVDGGMSVKM
ncbi:MAG: SDR family oxidoreductase [Pseudomonadota bacterium]